MRTLLIFLLEAIISAPQKGANYAITPGIYDDLKIAYNPQNRIITGYYFSGIGDDANGHPRFTCTFYLEGKLIGNKAKLITYYPLDKNDIQPGALTLTDHDEFEIKLADDHGGCWQVQRFAKEPVDFQLTHKANWLETKYIITPKAYFYNEKNDAAKRKGYLVKGDVVYIDKIESGWLHCTYYNESDKSTTGWVKSYVINVDPE